MNQRAKKLRLTMLIVALVITCVVSLSCSLFQTDPEEARKYPWLTQPVRAETKAYFCEKLKLPADDPVCRVDHNTFSADLAHALEEKFPVNKTFYSEIAEILNGYPVEVENTKTPDGTITSRRYVYLLTEFDGFCVDFYVRDLQTEVVDRIDSSSVGSGPTPTTCGSLKLREQPRPWLK
jgi:hypothetical protein